MFYLDENIITYVDKHKYLGRILNETLDYTVTTNVLSEAAGRSLGAVLNKLLHNSYLNFETYEKLYNSYVCPIVDYCSGIWRFRKYDKCITVQNRALRAFLGVNRFTANAMIIGDTDWIQPSIRHKLSVIRLWNRLHAFDPSRLTKKAFVYDYNLKLNHTWCHDVKKILYECGYHEYYDSFLPCTPIMDSLKQVLINKSKQMWCSELVNQSKLRTYKTYKHNVGKELYIKIGLSRYHRSLLERLRSCTLPLMVETGRYTNVKYEDRKCKICYTDHVEDEENLIFYCDGYIGERVLFFSKISNYCTNFINFSMPEKLCYLFSNEFVIKLLVNYLSQIINIRSQKIFQ